MAGRVGVAEDDPALTKLLAAVLRRGGHEVVTASTGPDALGLAVDGDIDLLILDLMLPGFDGFEVLGRLPESGRSMPVLVLSARASGDDRRRALAGGAAAYMTKPFDPKSLLSAVDDLLSGRGATLTPVATGPDGAALETDRGGPVMDEATVPPASVARGVVDLAIEAVVTVDADQRIVDFNRGAVEMFGYRPEEVHRQSLDVLLPVEAVATHREHIERFALSGEDARRMGQRREIRGRRRDGTTFPAEASILKQFVEGSWTFTAVLRDVSERHELLAQLRARAEQQTVVAELGQRALATASFEELLEELAASAAETLRCDLVILSKVSDGTLHTIGGYGLDRSVVGDVTVPIGDSHVGYTLAIGEPVIYEGPDRETRFTPSAMLERHRVVCGVAVPIVGTDRPFGTLAAYSRTPRTFTSDEASFLQSLATIVSALAERERADRRLRAFLDAAPDATLVVDADGSIVHANPQCEKLLGYPAAELVGMPVEALVPDAVRSRHLRHREGFAENPRARPMGAGLPLAARRADGTEVPVDIMLNALEVEGGPYVVAALRDVTERRHAEQMRDAFLHAVSHDLRTPLSTLSGWAHLMKMDPDMDAAERAEGVDRIVASAERLDRLLTDLLDLDRLTRGVVAPNRRTTDVVALAQRILDEVDAQGRRIRLHPDAPVIADVDPGQVERVVENLLVNFVRHTSADSTCEVTVASDGSGGVVLEVEDDGPGVPDHLKDLIFSPFERGEPTNPSPGSGIGLSLVLRFAELHGGTASVTDAPGGGALFRITFPADAPA